jgi:hypothetical protein
LRYISYLHFADSKKQKKVPRDTMVIVSAVQAAEYILFDRLESVDRLLPRTPETS